MSRESEEAATPPIGCVPPATDLPDASGVCELRLRGRLLAVGCLDPGAAHAATIAVAASRLAVRHVEAADPGAAVAYLREHKVKCVVVDATASADAAGVVGQITAARAEVPIVVIGADEDVQSAARVVQAGAQDYLPARGLDALALERAIRHAIDRHRTRAELQRLALYDQLTGAANRTLFAERLEAAIAQPRDSRCAVMCIEMDGFKRINECLGHRAGDAALRAIAKRIEGAVGPDDLTARMGGDEFAVLCLDAGSDGELLTLAADIGNALRMPLDLYGAEVVMGASIGVAADTGAGSASLLHAAGLAAQVVKREGGGRAELCSVSADARADDIRLEADLRRAIPGEMRLVYQPQVSFADGRVIGAEALVRWEHPERGLVSPGEFIPLAESSGLVVPLGRWVLHEACRQAADLRDADGIPMRVAVNVSGRQLFDPGLVSDVESALRESGLPAERLHLELTESVLVGDLDAGAAVASRLKDLGVSLALDDFGTGYSSLSYLKRLPIDTIKVDRSFVVGLPGCVEDLAIVSAVVAFAGALGMTALAEGVETPEQAAALAELGCDEAQGFLFHRPLEPARLAALWNSERLAGRALR